MTIIVNFLFYLLALAAGGSFVIIYQQLRYLKHLYSMVEDEEDYDENDIDEDDIGSKSIPLTVQGGTYDVPFDVYAEFQILTKAAMRMADDLVDKKHSKKEKVTKDGFDVFCEYYNKGVEDWLDEDEED